MSDTVLLNIEISPSLQNYRARSDDQPAVRHYQVRLEALFPNAASPEVVEASRGLDHAALHSAEADPSEYGRILSDFLFGERDGYALCRKARQRGPIRARLKIASELRPLQWVAWERLVEPSEEVSPRFLSVQEDFWLSRTTVIEDRRLVRLPAKGGWGALVASAFPAVVARRGLVVLPAADEARRAAEGLGPIASSVEALATDMPENPASLDNIRRALARPGGREILYVYCHGGLDEHRAPWLWLDREDGAPSPVAGGDLASVLRDLERRPVLVVLAGCYTAGAEAAVAPGLGDSAGEAIEPLAELLVRAGIPAVVGVRGRLDPAFATSFFPRLFDELAVHGEIDRALAKARAATPTNLDGLGVVLYSQLRDGRTWYTPGFPTTRPPWLGIETSLRNNRCVAFLGPQLLQFLAPWRAQIRAELAAQAGYPLPSRDVDDLADVLQYLAMRQGRGVAEDQVFVGLCQRVARLLGEEFDGSGSAGERAERLAEGLSRWQGKRKLSAPEDSYGMLASLPFSIYVTSGADRLLERCIARQPWKDGTRRPRSLVLDWRGTGCADDPGAFARFNPWGQDPTWSPSVGEPVVFHLFGVYEIAESLVLTRDAFLDYLLQWERVDGPAKLQKELKFQLVGSRALLLGFDLDSWEFRSLLRILAADSRFPATGPHVAAQAEPEEGDADSEAVIRYLQESLERIPITLYWGQAHHFLAELTARLNPAAGGRK